MVASTELYDVLNISTDADAKEIKKSYRKLALKYHPDKNNNSAEYNEIFQKINLAYNILIDVDKRSYYDKYGDVENAKNYVAPANTNNTTTATRKDNTSTSSFSNTSTSSHNFNNFTSFNFSRNFNTTFNDMNNWNPFAAPSLSTPADLFSNFFKQHNAMANEAFNFFSTNMYARATSTFNTTSTSTQPSNMNPNLTNETNNNDSRNFFTTQSTSHMRTNLNGNNDTNNNNITNNNNNYNNSNNNNNNTNCSSWTTSNKNTFVNNNKNFDNTNTSTTTKGPFNTVPNVNSTFGNNEPKSKFNRQTSTNPKPNSNVNPNIKGPDIIHNLKCNLGELYKGKICKLALQRTKTCFECFGNGGHMVTKDCQFCNGTGQINDIPKDNTNSKNWSKSCIYCYGIGNIKEFESNCKNCQNKGFINEKTVFKINIKPGMFQSQTIILDGEADEWINSKIDNLDQLDDKLNNLNDMKNSWVRVEPGDVIIKICEIDDDRFSRYKRSFKGKHENLLLNDFPIDIVTYLCGGKIIIGDHPIGKLLQANILPGELLRPNGFKCLENLGMPILDDTSDFKEPKTGNLYIKFKVELPSKLEAHTIDQLKQVLSNDKFIAAQQMEEKYNIYSHLDDCVEVEEHSLKNLQTEKADQINDQFETGKKRKHGSDGEDPHKRRKRSSFDEEQQKEDCVVN